MLTVPAKIASLSLWWCVSSRQLACRRSLFRQQSYVFWIRVHAIVLANYSAQGRQTRKPIWHSIGTSRQQFCPTKRVRASPLQLLRKFRTCSSIYTVLFPSLVTPRALHSHLTASPYSIRRPIAGEKVERTLHFLRAPCGKARPTKRNFRTFALSVVRSSIRWFSLLDCNKFQHFLAPHHSLDCLRRLYWLAHSVISEKDDAREFLTVYIHLWTEFAFSQTTTSSHRRRGC